MITGRVGAISGLLAVGLWVSTVGQAQAQSPSIVQRVATLESAVSTLTAQLATAQSNITTLNGQIAYLQTNLANTQSNLATLNTTVETLQTQQMTAQSTITTLNTTVGTLQSKVMAIANDGALGPLGTYVKVVDTGSINGLTGPHVIFEGANVHIRSGSGFTDDNTTQAAFGVSFFGDASGTPSETLTGRGNLIIGYDETSALSGTLSSGPRTGSHNLVVGPVHTFSSWGGMVAGFKNAITGISSSVSGGGGNTASGVFFSSVSGGEQNTASGQGSSVSGGVLNTASGNASSVSGGGQNTASGGSSSVSGGSQRSATALFNWAAGSLSEPD